jgi:hypothetical protein
MAEMRKMCWGGGWVYVVKSSQNGGEDAIGEKTERETLNSNRQEGPR